MTKIITFLGLVNKYKKTKFEINDKILEMESKFGTIGIIEVLKEKYKINPKNLEIFTLTTEKSSQFFDEFKREIKKVYPEIKIKETKYNEKNLWDIFEKIDEIIEKNDEIFINITHAYRFIPFIVNEMISYLEITKNVKIKNIFYIEFNEEKNIQKIKTLEDFLEFKKLKNSVMIFRETGQTRKLYEELTKINKEYKQKYGKNDQIIEKISKILNITQIYEWIFNALGKNLDFDRENKIQKTEKIFDEISNIKSYGKLSMIVNLIKSIENEFNKINPKNFFPRSIYAAEYCINKKLYVPANILLREGFISYIIYKLHNNIEDVKDKKIRDNIESKLGKLLNIYGKNRKLKDKISLLFNAEIDQKIGEIWSMITNLRNSFAHANYSNNDVNLKKIEKELRKIINEIKELDNHL